MDVSAVIGYVLSCVLKVTGILVYIAELCRIRRENRLQRAERKGSRVSREPRSSRWRRKPLPGPAGPNPNPDAGVGYPSPEDGLSRSPCLEAELWDGLLWASGSQVEVLAHLLSQATEAQAQAELADGLSPPVDSP